MPQIDYCTLEGHCVWTKRGNANIQLAYCLNLGLCKPIFNGDLTEHKGDLLVCGWVGGCSPHSHITSMCEKCNSCTKQALVEARPAHPRQDPAGEWY